MKAGVPIVPISVVGTFETYPPAAALPILPNGENLRVHIHPQAPRARVDSPSASVQEWRGAPAPPPFSCPAASPFACRAGAPRGPHRGGA